MLPQARLCRLQASGSSCGIGLGFASASYLDGGLGSPVVRPWAVASGGRESGKAQAKSEMLWCVCLQGLLCPGVHDPGSSHEWFKGCSQTVRGKRFLMLCYVDDLILCETKESIRLVTDTLNGEKRNHLYSGARD